MSEGRLGIQPARVVTGGGQQLTGHIRADAFECRQFGGGLGGQGRELGFQPVDLLGQGQDAMAKAAQGGFGR